MAFYNSIDDVNNFVISFSSHPQRDFGVFARGYYRAAFTLAQNLLERDRFSDYEAYPVVFLYRQAFELYLKGFYYKSAFILASKNSQSVDCSGIYSHRLVPLAKAFEDICKILFPSDQQLLKLADKVNGFANEFEQIDFDSFSYRYPIDKRGNPSTKRNQIVNLLALHQFMQEMLNDLEIVDFGFDIETSQAQEIYEVIQKAQSMIASENSEGS